MGIFDRYRPTPPSNATLDRIARAIEANAVELNGIRRLLHMIASEAVGGLNAEQEAAHARRLTAEGEQLDQSTQRLQAAMDAANDPTP